MPLERLSAPPSATVDPRLARRRKAEELKSERSTPAIPGSSSGGSVGPDRAASTSSREPRRTTTPYNRSLSSKPAPTIFPHSMHAQHERGKIYCGSCLEYHPESDFASKQLSDARRSIARAEREHRELKASDFPKCRRGINQQILEIRIEADPWAAYESSDEEGDAAPATGPSRSSGQAGAAASAAPAWDADEAYGVRRGLGTVAEEGGGGAGGTGVVYDDDEDW
ncbi:hypothetical protein JCM10449v2_000634 [Rhodotorula kratochvilovae]